MTVEHQNRNKPVTKEIFYLWVKNLSILVAIHLFNQNIIVCPTQLMDPLGHDIKKKVKILQLNLQRIFLARVRGDRIRKK